MIGNGTTNLDSKMSGCDEEKVGPSANSFCRDFIRGSCTRDNCRYIHEVPPKACLKELFRFCHDYQNKGCFRLNCKFIHSSAEEEEYFYSSGVFPRDPRSIPVCPSIVHGTCKNPECQFIHPPDLVSSDVSVQNVLTQWDPSQYGQQTQHTVNDDAPPEAKYRRYTYEENGIDKQVLPTANYCSNCEALDHKVKLLHDNISLLLKRVADLTEKNLQLTSMNEFLLEQTASVRGDQSCVITSRHCTSAPVSLATVSVTPVVSLAGALPTLVPAAATPNLTLAPAASRAQLLTPAPQILTVSTTQQLVGNSGALIVTSAGAQQLMQVSDSGTLMGGGQTVVAVTPAQLTLAPQAQQLMSSASQTAVQQLVQQSALQPQLASQHQASQYAAAQQSVQHLAAAQQSAQHLAAAQQSAQHLAAAQQSAQHLAAAQQSAQHLAAAQQSAQHLAAAQQSAQHLAAQQSAQLAAQQSAQHITVQQSAQHLAVQQSAQHLAAQQSAQHLAQHSAQHLAQQSAQHLAAAQQSAQQLAAAAQQSAQQMVAQQSAQQLAAQQSAQQQLVPTGQQLVHQTSTQQITISSTSQPMALPNSQAQSLTFPIISQSILPH